MGTGGLEDGEHDGEYHEGGDGAGEEEEGGLQNGPEAADFAFRFMGKDFLCLTEEAGQFPAFHAHPAEMAHQGQGEAAFLQHLGKILASLQMAGCEREGSFCLFISHHIPGIPEGLCQGMTALQKGGEGGGETDQQNAPVETGTVQQAVGCFPSLFGAEEKERRGEKKEEEPAQKGAVFPQPQAEGQGQGRGRRKGDGQGFKKKGKGGKNEGENHHEKAESKKSDKERIGQGPLQLADETILLQVVRRQPVQLPGQGARQLTYRKKGEEERRKTGSAGKTFPHPMAGGNGFPDG